MNFYRRFPGDYARDTGHLTMLEHGAYNLLLDHLYATEQPIKSMETAIRICGAATKSQRKAVKLVLSLFFHKTPVGFHHSRVEKEISYLESKKQSARRSANARWNAMPSDSERNANASETQCSPDSRLQTTTKTPLPPAGAGESGEQFFTWQRETIGVQMGRRRRLPNLGSFDGAQAERVVEFLRGRGFPARIVRPA